MEIGACEGRALYQHDHSVVLGVTVAARLSADPTISRQSSPPLPMGPIPAPMRDEGEQAPRVP